MNLHLPSAGYFGGTAADFLEIPTNGHLKSLEILISGDDSEFLNLRGLEFRNGRRKIDVDNLIADVKQSSFRDSDQIRNPFTLLDKKGCHTALQQNPSWKITFHEFVEATSVRLYNRTDGWGIRSRNIEINLEFAGGRRESYSVNDPQRTYAILSKYVQFDHKLRANQSDATLPYPSVDISYVVDKLETSNEVLSIEESNALIALVPTAKGSIWGEYEFKLVARVLVDQKRRLRDASTGIRSFAFVLNTRTKLDKLQAEMDSATSRLGENTLRISRHGVYESGLLRKNINAHLTSIRRAMLLLQNHGYKSVLCYGTLLGAVREQKFIFHDDDVDIAVIIDDDSSENVQEEMGKIANIFKAEKYGLDTLSEKHHNIHVRDSKNGGVLDIFPILISGDAAFLHMEKMNWRSVSAQWFRDCSIIELHDQLFPAPGNAEALLAERYGETWDVPDPYYEWTWPLANK